MPHIEFVNNVLVQNSISAVSGVFADTLNAKNSISSPDLNQLKSASGNWNSTYTTVSSNSSNWQSVYNTFKSTSGSFLTTETDSQTLSYNEPAIISISNGNTVSLSSLDVRSLSSNWQSTYSTVSSNSASWQSTYSTVNANSATTWNYQGADLKALSSNWENTYSTVSTNSAAWSANPQVIEATVFNADTVPLVRGNVVYSFGATGSTMSVKLASNTSDTTSSKTLGIVNGNIAVGGTGTVTVMGRMDNLNFGAPFVEGDALWLNSTPGVYTNIKPVAPNHGVYLGVVERANSGNGIAYIKIQNGYELNEIHDVLITTPLSGQMLRRNSANTLWVNTDDGTKWDGVYSTVQANSANAWTYDNTKLPLSGGALTGPITGTDATFTGTVSTNNLYGNLLAKINYYNSSSTTLSLNDAGAIVKIDVNSGSAYLYVDTEANVGWIPGSQIVIVQWGTQTINFVANLGVVINSYSNFSYTKGQYSMATLIYLGSDVWALGGNLS